MKKKPDLIDILEHVNPSWNLTWGFSLALDWIAVRYEAFCKGSYLAPENSYDRFRDWLLEKYWPDWEESYNG